MHCLPPPRAVLIGIIWVKPLSARLSASSKQVRLVKRRQGHNFRMPLLPNIQWAQRKDRVYLTIDLQNAKNPTIKLNNGSDGKHGHVSFKGKAQSHATGADAHEYEVELDLFGAIDSEESKISISDRSVLLVIAKQQPSTYLHNVSWHFCFLSLGDCCWLV